MTQRSPRSRSRRPGQGATRVRANSPADLLALVPYLLGFRPSESLVVLLIRDGQVLLTARIDLPPPELLEAVTSQFSDLAQAHRAAGLVLFAYSGQREPARALLTGLVGTLSTRGLLDAVYVGEHRWWSLMCTGRCCPAEGTIHDPTGHRLAAEAVYAGLATAPDRRAVEAQVAGLDAADVELLARLGREAEAELRPWSAKRRAAEMSSKVGHFLSAPRGLDDAECARLAVLAGDLAVRDVAWAQMTRDDVTDHLDLWGQVVARTVAPWEAAPLCLLGMAAWISRNGALQNCCSDRARRIAPDYTLAGLLDEINQRALPPSFWDQMAAEMNADPALLAGGGRGR